MGIILIELIFKNFYLDCFCFDFCFNYFYIVKNLICNVCLFLFFLREICYDIFIVVVNKNFIKFGNIKIIYYLVKDGFGFCLKVFLIMFFCIFIMIYVIY